MFLLLTQIWSSPGAFTDLPCSVSDAAEFYRAEEGSSTEKLFWSQYLGPEHPLSFSDQLKQLVELHKAAELAMKDLIVRLWPAEPMPNCYFGLVKWLVSACPRLEVMKRSFCIEGARMAFASVKTHWAKMDAKKLMTEGHLRARSTADPSYILIVSWRDPALWRSSVRRMLYSHENIHLILSCNMKQGRYVI